MTEHNLNPSCVRYFYHSPLGRHIATLPTRKWSVLGGTTGHGGYEGWDASNVDAETMILDMAEGMAQVMPDSAAFDSYIIYDEQSVGGVLVPVQGNAITQAGADATPGWFPAVQFTYTFFDSSFFPAKLIVLDAASNGDFSKLSPSAWTSAQEQAPLKFAAGTNAWASRAGFQPLTPRSLSQTLNRKLRKQYGLT